jgi:hypothetical protein
MSVVLAFATAFFCCTMLASFFDLEGEAGFFDAKEPRIGFPRKLFTLPVPTRTLVFWPWLFGTTGSGLLSVVCGTLLNWLLESDVPVVVWAVGAAVCMAWLQVAFWTPVRVPGIRSLAWLSGAILPIVFVAWLYFRSGLSLHAILAVLVSCLALSYPAALAAVARDRRGDAWPLDLSIAARLWPFRRRAARVPRAFGSLARAQRWYNWWDPRAVLVRVLLAPLAPLMAAMVLVALTIELSEKNPIPGPFPGPLSASLRFFVLPLVVLLSMRLLVSFLWAKGIDPIQRRPSFVLVRPINSGTLTATLLRTILRGALWSGVYWLLLVLGAWLCWDALSTKQGMQELELLFARLPAWQIVGVIFLLAVAIVGILWWLISHLLLLFVGLHQPDHWCYVGLSLAMAGFSGVVAVGISLLLDRATRPLAIDALAGAGVVILLAKAVVAGMAFRFAYRDGLLEGMSLRRFFLAWSVLAIGLLSATAAVLPGLGLPVPTSLVLLWLVILLPLARFALIPPGLEAVRHR